MYLWMSSYITLWTISVWIYFVIISFGISHYIVKHNLNNSLITMLHIHVHNVFHCFIFISISIFYSLIIFLYHRKCLVPKRACSAHKKNIITIWSMADAVINKTWLPMPMWSRRFDWSPVISRDGSRSRWLVT